MLAHEDWSPDPMRLFGFKLGNVIGEGANACVRLACHAESGEVVAVKVVYKDPKRPDIGKSLRKEATIHKSVAHPNTISLYAMSEDELAYYLIMEYGAGGELFDRIAPDVGVGENLAHFYFRQLVAGMAHLHACGIAHRDLKPEPVKHLEGNLKISDFGLATVFRHKGVVRSLTTPCGSAPYVAPEIYQGQYEGEQVDIWSSGIILYALLAGNTPWAEPTKNDPEFSQYLVCYPNNLNYDPWTRLSRPVLRMDHELFIVEGKCLIAGYENRPNAILSSDGLCKDTIALAEMMKSQMYSSQEQPTDSDAHMISYSQPEVMFSEPMSQQAFSQSAVQRNVFSFSQPIAENAIDEEMVEDKRSDPTLSQVQRQGFVDLFPSNGITRFYCSLESFNIFQRLCSTLTDFVVPYKINRNLMQIVFSTVDKRKCPLNGEIRIQPATDDVSLVVFRKSKGDPIEFKRFYKAILETCEDVIVRL
ncbi:Chk1 protein kinase [Dinochytrium kinnereticum]|nr:Chk1 protein kinase [Dinochytrium kinnereticum]